MVLFSRAGAGRLFDTIQTIQKGDYMNRIYADNAATTPVSETARRVYLETMDRAWGNPSSLHSTGQEAAEVLLKARQDVARCLNAQREREITFTSGGSEADNQALLTGAMLGKKKGKMHIISTKFEHHAVLHSLKRLEKEGFEVTLLEVGRKAVSYTHLRAHET